ncbi:magnesium chelatase subunit D [Paracoccus spongiarum]|uniref:Magnesium chelatase subunit D n=1 Tax=Paracoccus spongiarum TaxID=3064387 RepID=A0ABT9JC31_9RHOB|nr:magnesium chelatase subunit D [Paracoccus sp. 2205BS29-5]MDP5307368.1 magnesium chelatase subunit D [Paracoccus sp. 2205BS29-5]
MTAANPEADAGEDSGAGGGDAPPDGWARAMRALAVLAVDPGGLGGLTLRARAGPVRHAFDAACAMLPLDLPRHRIGPATPEDRLCGGIDVLASLGAGRMVRVAGLAARPAMLVLVMAERTDPRLAATLAGILDRRHGHCLILQDEGATPDEVPPAALRDRLAFAVDLDDVRHARTATDLPDAAMIGAARQRLAAITGGPEDAATLVMVAASLGIESLRAPLLALRVARALAALSGRGAVAQPDLREAAELVLAPRATRLPQPRPDDHAPPPPEPAEGDLQDNSDSAGATPPHEMIVEAVAASLPPHLLARLASDAGATGAACRGSGAGARVRGNRRGRPLPARPGRPDGRARIDLIATLRAAAPFQRLRRADCPGTAAGRVIVTPSDLRLCRHEDRSDRLLIFCVDASGSAAMARMAEAKGAVELFLADAYAQRDHVALLAFRGTRAEMLLAPTRALVMAKRRLAALPGGGGTPLAAGLVAAHGLGLAARRQGFAPALILLTDGRGNVGLDERPGREAAADDARRVAAMLRGARLPCIVLDSAPRPGAEASVLAGWLGARHLALPRADARAMRDAAAAALAG